MTVPSAEMFRRVAGEWNRKPRVAIRGKTSVLKLAAVAIGYHTDGSAGIQFNITLCRSVFSFLFIAFF